MTAFPSKSRGKSTRSLFQQTSPSVGQSSVRYRRICFIGNQRWTQSLPYRRRACAICGCLALRSIEAIDRCHQPIFVRVVNGYGSSQLWLLKPAAVVADDIPLGVFRKIADVLAPKDIKRAAELPNFLYQFKNQFGTLLLLSL